MKDVTGRICHSATLKSRPTAASSSSAVAAASVPTGSPGLFENANFLIVSTIKPIVLRGRPIGTVPSRRMLLRRPLIDADMRFPDEVGVKGVESVPESRLCRSFGFRVNFAAILDSFSLAGRARSVKSVTATPKHFCPVAVPKAMIAYDFQLLLEASNTISVP